MINKYIAFYAVFFEKGANNFFYAERLRSRIVPLQPKIGKGGQRRFATLLYMAAVAQLVEHIVHCLCGNYLRLAGQLTHTSFQRAFGSQVRALPAAPNINLGQEGLTA